MSKRMIFMTLLIVLLTPVYTIAGNMEPARLSLVDGDIMIRTADAPDWQPVSVNTPLYEGDAVWCPDGARTEIQIAGGSIVRLDSGSQLNMLANDENFTHLYLASGRLYLKTSPNIMPNSLQIDADDTTVLPSAHTRLRLDMLPNGQEDVSIFKGSAYVEGNGSRTRVRAGEHIALEEGHSDLLPLNPADNWEIWNMDQDRRLSNSANAESNLPDELISYSGELESHGRWVRVPEYGMVWRPTVILSDEWVPYRNGRWVWRGDDYVWISFEIWGWVPYHYGRWTVISNLGWCWIPPLRGDVYWGPGYVGWYRTGSHVGWTPLAPGEMYYGYGYHGRQSVNISTATINTNSVDYRNRHFRGGVTVLPQNDFLKGRVATSQPALNSSVAVSVSVGSPRIKHLMDTRTPAVRQATPAQHSPTVEHKDNRELRQRFPRVTPEIDPRQHNQQVAPVIIPQQKEHDQRLNSPPVSQPRANPQSGEKPRPESTRNVVKQKRVWRIKTPDTGKERDRKVIEQKSREHKEKQ